MYVSGDRKATLCVLEKVKIMEAGWVMQWAGNLWRLHSMGPNPAIAPKLMERRRDGELRKSRLAEGITSAKRTGNDFQELFTAE
jgi:hypothetical protein